MRFADRHAILLHSLLFTLSRIIIKGSSLFTLTTTVTKDIQSDKKPYHGLISHRCLRSTAEQTPIALASPSNNTFWLALICAAINSEDSEIEFILE